jgi:hypothetical protein
MKIILSSLARGSKKITRTITSLISIIPIMQQAI